MMSADFSVSALQSPLQDTHPTPAHQIIAARRPRRHTATVADRINTIVSIVSLPLFVLVWEWVSRSGIINQVLFPPPTIVAAAISEWITSGDFFLDIVSSFARVLIGFLIGSTTGIVIGVLTGRIAFFASLFNPIFQILRPIPPIAFVPIVILWFGLAETGKIFLIVWGVFFTVWLATHMGVQKVDTGLIRAGQMLGTPRLRMLREIIFLGALPYIVVGLRTAVGISFYTLVAAELAGAFSGVFYRIALAQQNMQTGKVLGGLVVLGLISSVADRTFAVFARRVVWWR